MRYEIYMGENSKTNGRVTACMVAINSYYMGVGSIEGKKIIEWLYENVGKHNIDWGLSFIKSSILFREEDKMVAFKIMYGHLL